MTISAKRAKEVIAMNRKGNKPEILDENLEEDAKPVVIDYENGVGQDSLTRFDSTKKRSNKNRRSNKGSQQKKQEASDNKKGTTENKGGAPRFQKPIKKNNNGSTQNEK